MIVVRQIREEDALALREVLDAVCRERRYLATLEAPPMERFQKFVSSNVKSDYPQFVAEIERKIAGWCDAIPGEASHGVAHIGRLGMGVLKDYRGKNIGLNRIKIRGQHHRRRAAGCWGAAGHGVRIHAVVTAGASGQGHE